MAFAEGAAHGPAGTLITVRTGARGDDVVLLAVSSYEVVRTSYCPVDIVRGSYVARA